MDRPRLARRPGSTTGTAAPSAPTATSPSATARSTRFRGTFPARRRGPDRADVHLGGHARGDRPGDDDLRGPRRRPHPAARASRCATPSRAATACWPAAWRSASTRATPSSTPCSPTAPSEMALPEPGRAPPRGAPRPSAASSHGDRRLAGAGAGGRAGPPATWSPTSWSGSPASWPAAGSCCPPGRPVADDPVAAWQHHADAVQARARRRGGERVLHPPVRRHPPPRRRDRPVLHRRRLHAHLGPGPGHRPGRSTSTRTSRPRCSAGMGPIEDVLRSSGQYGAPVPVARRRPRRRPADGLHRPRPGLDPAGDRAEAGLSPARAGAAGRRRAGSR